MQPKTLGQLKIIKDNQRFGGLSSEEKKTDELKKEKNTIDPEKLV